MPEFCCHLADETATLAVGAALAQTLRAGESVWLHGDLGVGKTTLTRGVLRAKGYTGAVKSPTYTLVEPYQLADGFLYHFDLYRISDPDELHYLALEEYFHSDAISLIEWAERGVGVLPAPTLELCLSREGKGRTMRLTTNTSKRGIELLDFLSKSIHY